MVKSACCMVLMSVTLIIIGVLLRASVGPVLGAHHLGEHDNRVDVVVPNKPPEVAHSVGEGTLGSYVLPVVSILSHV